MGTAKDILVVCEDGAHRAFVRQCLKSLGVKDLKWHWYDYTASKVRTKHGNRAEVIERLANNEYDEWKRRNASRKVLLIAVIDADGDEIGVALQRLNPPKDGTCADRFVALIPKRNIQTWVVLAESGSGSEPNENDDYKTSSTKDEDRARVSARKLTALFNERRRDPGADIGISDNPAWHTFWAQMETLHRTLVVGSWI